MKIEDGKVKPCSTCLKIRQNLKTGAGKILRRQPAAYSLVQLTDGDITVRNSDHVISAVTNSDWERYIGLHVYLAGRLVYAVEAARPITALGQIVKVSPVS